LSCIVDFVNKNWKLRQTGNIYGLIQLNGIK